MYFTLADSSWVRIGAVGAQIAGKRFTGFPCCSAWDGVWRLLAVRGWWSSEAESNSPGLCLKGSYSRRASFPFLLAKAEGSCVHGGFIPLHYMVPFNSSLSFTGQDKCFPCPAGFHCSNGLRRRCPPGFYCPQNTGISFYPCPPGTYNPSYGLSQAERCQHCPAGEEITLLV